MTQLRITRYKGGVPQASLVTSGQNIPLLDGEEYVFCVEAEGAEPELFNRLRRLAREEAPKHDLDPDTIIGLKI